MLEIKKNKTDIHVCTFVKNKRGLKVFNLIKRHESAHMARDPKGTIPSKK